MIHPSLYYKALLLFITIIFNGNMYSQEKRFFIPVEIQKAYADTTRSYNGSPGAKYWQNTADYVIKAEVDIQKKALTGSEEIIYFNNSPDEITELVLRLYQDAYKMGNTRMIPIDPRDAGEGISLESVTINGTEYDIQQARRTATNIVFYLNNPLKPRTSLSLKATWKQNIPEFSPIRTGVYDNSVFFLAYWYPQIAVYDDIFGWDLLDYNFRTEFYNNLSNYDVTIHAPSESVVWATGTLVNPHEVLPPETAVKYAEAHNSAETVHILEAEDINKFTSPNPYWHFTAREVSDFAFAVGSELLWDASTLVLDNRKILISSVVSTDYAADQKNHMSSLLEGMQHFSRDIPGVPYPYEAFTTIVCQGGGGMEYPMLALNGGTDRRTTLHEMFHTWFPMYVRTNETRWAWMDEGITNYNTHLLGNRFYGNENNFARMFSSTMGFTGTYGDVPLIFPSQFLIDPYYRWSSYQASEMLYGILHHHLGDELFIRCYREYIRRWAKKAPTPFDFFYTFENVSGKDLGWLWKPWFFEFGSIDVAIGNFEGAELSVVNKGQKPVPLFIYVKYKDGKTHQMDVDASIWSTSGEYKVIIPDHKNVEWISINQTLCDATPKDNFYPSLHSLNKKLTKLKGLAGDYMLERYSSRMSISNEDDLFIINMPRMNLYSYILPLSENQFVSLDGSMIIDLITNESNEVKALNINWNGIFHAAKIQKD